MPQASNHRPLYILASLAFFIGFLILSSRWTSTTPKSALVSDTSIIDYLPSFGTPWHNLVSPGESDASPKQGESQKNQVQTAGHGRVPGALSSSTDNELDLRKHLDASTSSLHSKTLSFSHIYVVSLPNRIDRRETMTSIATALGIELTFIDAVNKDAPVIKWIGEQAHTMRQKKLPFLARATGRKQNELGGTGVRAIWLARPGQKGSKGVLTLPSAQEDRFGGMDWVEYMNHHEGVLYKQGKKEESGKESCGGHCLPKDTHFNVTEALFDPLDKTHGRQMNDAVLSTWKSHMKAVHMMEINNDDSALVMEDDVDIEWNIERMWSAIHRKLPTDWDMTFLGHCWGREMTYPTNLHPALYHSYGPRCLHGYALSRTGYQKILRLMNEPWSAYQAAVDNAIPTLIASGDLSSYSIEPPLIIQSKKSPSDIQPGIGSSWRGLLQDSTMDRIWRDEGHAVPDMEFAEARKDPYVQKPHVLGQSYW